ncbi:MAG: ABC transporter substrate-binding protein [Clostridia bacterium]
MPAPYRPRFRLVSLLASVGLLVALTACGSAAPTSAPGPHPIRLYDDLHHLVVLKRPARRLVVLEPSNFEIVDALGLRQDIVGVDTSVPGYTPPPWGKAARGLPSVGPSYPGISVERIVARRPALVLATTGIAGLKGLSTLRIPVLVLNPQSVNGVYRDIKLVGEATGTEARATTLIRRMKQEVAALTREVARTSRRPLVFYDLGGLYTTGRHTFLDSLIQMAGARNVGAELSTAQWPQVTDEQVVRANPSVILVDPDATTVAKERQIPGFLDTRAGRTGHIVAVPQSSYINEPSLGLVAGLRELIKILHPGLLK